MLLVQHAGFEQRSTFVRILSTNIQEKQDRNDHQCLKRVDIEYQSFYNDESELGETTSLQVVTPSLITNWSTRKNVSVSCDNTRPHDLIDRWFDEEMLVNTDRTKSLLKSSVGTLTKTGRETLAAGCDRGSTHEARPTLESGSKTGTGIIGWRALSDAPPVMAREHETHAKSFQEEGTRTRVYDSSTSPCLTTQPLPFRQNNEKLK